MGWFGRFLLLGLIGVGCVWLLLTLMSGWSVFLVREAAVAAIGITALVAALFQLPVCRGLIARGLVLVLAGLAAGWWAVMAGTYGTIGLGGPAIGNGFVLLVAFGGVAIACGLAAIGWGIGRRMRPATTD